MNEKNLKLLNAAVEIFGRYGVRRATMADVAKEAGVSRQTLYASYASKDELMGATILFSAQHAVAQVEAAFEKVGSLDEQLQVFFQHAIIDLWEMIQKTPDAADIIGGQWQHEPCLDAINEATVMKQRVLTEILAPHEKAIEKSGQSVEQFSAFVQNAAMNFKHSATTKKELLSLLASLKISVLAVTGG